MTQAASINWNPTSDGVECTFTFNGKSATSTYRILCPTEISQKIISMQPQVFEYRPITHKQGSPLVLDTEFACRINLWNSEEPDDVLGYDSEVLTSIRTNTGHIITFKLKD